MPEERLYIKLILPRQGLDKKVHGGGGEAEPFKKITPDFTNRILQTLDHAAEAIRAESSHLKIIPLHVSLEQKALAKSHRPTELFNEKTCPIIGVGKLGELFIKGTPAGISALTAKIKRQDSKNLIKAVSTIKELNIVGTERKLLGRKPAEVLENSPVIKGLKTVKVALFDYRNESENSEKDRFFEEFLNQNRLLFEKMGTGQNILPAY